VTAGSEPRGRHRAGPEDVAPGLHADEERPGSPPAEVDPGVEAMPGTSEEFEPVQGLHVPEVGEHGVVAPGRYRTDGPGAEAAEQATDDAPRP
jgi:hypothetical protein